MYKRMLITLDGSPLAEEVVVQATELALQCESQVLLLQVIVPVRSVMGPAEFGAAPYADYTEEFLKRTEEEAKAYLEWTAQPMREKGIDVQCVTVRGLAAEEIIRCAKDYGVDLIIMATHGRSGIGRMVLGSVADEVLRKSSLPILLYKPGAQKKQEEKPASVQKNKGSGQR
ncbi:MAG: universal stress protein [SAR202 cluster bacterium]|nr:universal stress protein [SAR202 cluster bacterium]